MDEFDRAALDAILNGVPIRGEDLGRLLSRVHQGKCCSLVGVSNTGKSWVLRLLAEDQARSMCARAHELTHMVVFVDCLESGDSEHAFYVLLLRRIIEEADGFQVSAPTIQALKSLHQQMLHITSDVAARSLFGSCMRELAREAKLGLVLVFDEFEDAFRMLPPWPFRQLRAQHDAWHGRLRFITATHRRLESLRADRDTYEFRELFQLGTVILRPLGPADAGRFLSHVAARQRTPLQPQHAEAAIALSGGHPGLLETIYSLLDGAESGSEMSADSLMTELLGQPPIQDELRQILESLTDEDISDLKAVANGQGLSRNAAERPSLGELGLINWDDENRPSVFSPLLAAFAKNGFSRPVRAERGIRCDLDAGKVWIDGREVTWDLSELQRKVVHLLWRKQGQVCTRDEIMDYAWGVSAGVSPAALREVVSRLRIRIGDKDPGYIVPVRGEGYRLENPK